MAENQPRDFDVVLGGEAAPPVAGVVLGGLEGVKNRLESSNVEARFAALSDALNYGDETLDLVIQSLDDKVGKVRHKAFRILREKTDIQEVRQALLDYNPWQFFSKLENWKAEHFNTVSGITNSINKAYIVNPEQLKLLLQDPQAHQVEALICEIWDEDAFYEVSEEFENFVEILYDARKLLTNLRALFIGDGEVEEYKKSRRGLSDISLILDSALYE